MLYDLMIFAAHIPPFLAPSPDPEYTLAALPAFKNCWFDLYKIFQANKYIVIHRRIREAYNNGHPNQPALQIIDDF